MNKKDRMLLISIGTAFVIQGTIKIFLASLGVFLLMIGFLYPDEKGKSK